MGDIPSGGSAQVTIVVFVLPDTTGLLHNDATVSSDTLDTNNANNLASATTTVAVVAVLEVTKSDDQDPVIAGTNLKYTVTVTNTGPSTATMVDLVDTLPSETDLVSTEVLEGDGTLCPVGHRPRCGDLYAG